MSEEKKTARSPVRQLLARPVAFHPALARLCGSLTAGLMLSQAIYWSERTQDDSGWFYKTTKDWFEETYLSRFELEAARAKLCALKFLQEKRCGMPARMHYRVNINRIVEALESGFESEKSSLRETSKQECGKLENKIAENQQTGLRETSNQDSGKPAIKIVESSQSFLIGSESTTETTSESTAVRTPDGVPQKQTISSLKSALKISGREMRDLCIDALRVCVETLGCSQEQAAQTIIARWEEYLRLDPPFRVGVRKFLEQSMFLPDAQWIRPREVEQRPINSEMTVGSTRVSDGQRQINCWGCGERFTPDEKIECHQDLFCTDACREAYGTHLDRKRAEIGVTA